MLAATDDENYYMTTSINKQNYWLLKGNKRTKITTDGLPETSN